MWRNLAIVCAIATIPYGAPSASEASQLHAARACRDANLIAADAKTRQRAIKAVLCLVNQERGTHGVAVLHTSKRLARAAARHSAAMVARGYFGHRFPGSSELRQRARRTGYVQARSSPLLGETLAWGCGLSASPAELVMSFMNSPPHRRTMLSRRYRDLGIGFALGAPVAVADQAAMLTLNFGRR